VDLDDELRAFIQRVFGCPAEVAEVIGGRAAARSYPVRAVILRQGDPAGETFLLVAGRAHALLYGSDGQMVLLQEHLPGDLFGAIGELEPRPHEADVVAVEPARAAVFLALDFLALIERHACVGLAVSRLLLRQLRAATGRMAERVTLSAAGRVHAELLRLARLGDGRAIRPAPVLAALAVRVHSTRETVSRTISALERRGMIRREDDALVLVSPGRLEEMIV
jgi:CRP-like cAMP-binding protein